MATEKEPGGAEEPESVLALVTALRDTMIARAEGLRSEDADARTQALRARALGHLLMRGRLPTLAGERSTLRSFWRFIKVKLSTYDERWGSLKGDFRPLIRSRKEDDHEALGDDKRERMLGQGGLGQGWLSWPRHLDQPVGLNFSSRTCTPKRETDGSPHTDSTDECLPVLHHRLVPPVPRWGASGRRGAPESGLEGAVGPVSGVSLVLCGSFTRI